VLEAQHCWVSYIQKSLFYFNNKRNYEAIQYTPLPLLYTVMWRDHTRPIPHTCRIDKVGKNVVRKLENFEYILLQKVLNNLKQNPQKFN